MSRFAMSRFALYYSLELSHRLGEQPWPGLVQCPGCGHNAAVSGCTVTLQWWVCQRLVSTGRVVTSSPLPAVEVCPACGMNCAITGCEISQRSYRCVILREAGSLPRMDPSPDASWA